MGVNDNDYVWTMTLDRPFDLPQQRFELAECSHGGMTLRSPALERQDLE